MDKIGSASSGTGRSLVDREHEKLDGSVQPSPLAEYYNSKGENLQDGVRYLEAETEPRIPSAHASRAATVTECYRQQRDVFGHPLDIDDLSYLACVLPPSAQFPHQTPVICPLGEVIVDANGHSHDESLVNLLNWFKETRQINRQAYICWVKFLTEQLASVTSDDEDSDVMDSDDDGSDSMSMDLDGSEPFGAGDKTPTSNMVFDKLTGKSTPDNSCNKRPRIDYDEGDDLAFLVAGF